jgi:hypothetical protein
MVLHMVIQPKHAVTKLKKSIDTAKGPKMKDLSDIEAEKKKKKKMSEMVATYQEQGLKGLFEALKKKSQMKSQQVLLLKK